MKLIKEWDEWEDDEKFDDNRTYDKKGRETIYLKDICRSQYLDLDGLNKEYEVIEETLFDTDVEKQILDYACVIKRKKDGKYFAFHYSQYGYNGSNIKKIIAHEVQKKQKMIDYYE